MTYSERFVVLSGRGEPTIRTNSQQEADYWAERLRGRVIDRAIVAVVS